MATDSDSVNSAAVPAAAATTTATNSNSPRHSSSDKNHPQSGRSTRSSPPWTQIVRGGESETVASAASAASIVTAAASGPPSSPSAVMAEKEVVTTVPVEENAENESTGRKPVWNKLSNRAVEIAPVMGADSWPALSDSAKVSTKTSSVSSDGSPSISAFQGTGTVPSSSQKQVSNISIPNSSPNNMVPARQRSMKRNSINASASSGALQSPGSQGQSGELPTTNPSPRDHLQRNSQHADHLQRNSQPRAASDHTQQQRSFRNRNGGSHSHNYGGRRDQERTNQDWNNGRNFNGRDAHAPPQRGYARFMRQTPPPPPPPLPPTSAPFIPPPPVRPYGNPMGFPAPVYYVAAPPESLQGLPFVAAPIPPHAMYFPPQDLQLHSKILNQIEYYFSNDNLVKDTYLRQNMDDQGWVSINLIAGFNKVTQLTDNIALILDAIRNSNIIEVQGDKLRRRNDWSKWLVPPTSWLSNASIPQSMGKPNLEMLAGNFQHVSLEESAGSSSARTESDVHNEALQSSSSSGSLFNHSNTESEGAAQVSSEGDADHSTKSSSS